MKKLIFILIAIMLVSCTVENMVEPTPVTVTTSSSKEIPVKYFRTEYAEYYDSVGVNNGNQRFVDELAVWESGGQYWGKYLKEGKWVILSTKVESFKY